MTSPYSQSYQTFASGTAATANATLPLDIKWGGSVAFQYVGSGFSGALDFQGRPHSSASWVNLPYVVMGANPAPSVAQVSWTTDSSTVTYVVLMPMEEMRVVMTRSAGSFGMWAHSFEHPLLAIIGALPAGTNAIGKLAANSGVDIGDVDVTSLPATPAGTNLLGSIAAVPSTSSVMNGVTAVTPVFAAISGAISGDNTLVAADATKKIRVFSLYVVAVTAVTVRFESAAGGTALSGVMSVGANGGFVLPFNPNGWFETTANQLLNMELGGAVQVSGGLSYGLV